MSKIIEASKLPEEEKIYLKKDFLGWRVVEPIIDPETKKFILGNFATKKGFFLLAVLIIFLAICYLAFEEQYINYRNVVNNPCAYCTTCQEQTRELIRHLNSEQIPKINFTLGVDN